MPIPSGKLAARQAYVVANRWNWPTCTINGVKGNQHGLLIDAGITGLETKEIATEPFASGVRFIQF